jgi:hypothetical protein
MLQKLYRWHRRLGLIVMLPILGWCLSGLVHTVAAIFFEIKPVHQRLTPQALVLDSTRLNLTPILEQWGIDTFQQMRWVTYNGQPYYQILRRGKAALYVQQRTGMLLENGDRRYAETLARHFIGDSSSSIAGIERIERFTNEYKFINRLLPVYKVSFNRADGMDVYVSTESSRLGTQNNHFRKMWGAVFDTLHHWTFLEAWPRIRTVLLLLFTGLSFLTALFGLLVYVFLWKQFKKQQPQARHRYLGLVAYLSTLAFTFSGGYRAFAKTQQEPPARLPVPTYTPAEVARLPELKTTFDLRPVSSISLAELEGQTYFRVSWLLPNAEPSYFNTQTIARISQGEERYALAQAKEYTKLPDSLVLSSIPVVKFGGEYGVIHKRLPVRKVIYQTPEKHHVYIETNTGDLAAVIQNNNRPETLMFLMLHNYHFLDAHIGEKGRGVVVVLLVLLIITVQLSGLALWWCMR